MFKVLIVDDEPIIRQGLRTLIDWEELGFTICGEAVNGRDGLGKAQELEPDLVIVDIKMPGIDGLEMIEELNKSKNKCRFIILSGYSEFSHAQKAIELGVDSYVLKPINKTELAEKVKKVYFSLRMDERIKSEFVSSEERIIQGIVTGELKRDDLMTAVRDKILNFPWKSYQVILVDYSHWEHTMDNKLCKEMMEFVNRNCEGISFIVNNIAGILVKDMELSAGSLPIKILIQSLKARASTSIVIAIGRVVQDAHDISISYEGARKLLESKFMYGSGDIVLDGVLEKEQDGIEVIDENKIIDGLYRAIDLNENSSIKEFMNKKLALTRNKAGTEEDIKADYAKMCTLLINRIIVNNPSLKDNSILNQNFFADIYKKKNLSDLNEFVNRTLIQISDELKKLRPDNLINKVMDFINRNYNSELKLESIAQTFNYNSSYLGKLFKSCTGEYFNVYIDKVRIEKAKQFLREDYKVYQVSEMVGYHDKDYFVEKFKKYSGVTPTAYKSSLVQGKIK